MKKLILISLFTLYSLLFTIYCLCAVGTTSANFLKIAVGARSSGMGETAVGNREDINSIYWNPAGLGTITGKEVSFLYTKWLDDMSYQYLLGASPVKFNNFPVSTVGFAVYNFAYGNIQGADYDGMKTTKIKASDLAFCFSSSSNIFENTYAGLSIKFINETLNTKNAIACGCDIGFLHNTDLLNGKMGFGASVRNLGTAMEFVSESYPLPINIAVGTSYKKNVFGLEDPLIVAVDVNLPTDNKIYFNCGAEYWVVNLIALRVGYKSGQDIGSGIRAGAGLRMNIFQLDFAYAGYDKLGDTFRLGMTLKFGKPTKFRITSLPVATEEIDMLLKSAEKLYNDCRYAKAILEYNKVLDIDGTNKKAIEMMRECNEKLKNRN